MVARNGDEEVTSETKQRGANWNMGEMEVAMAGVNSLVYPK